MDLRPHLQLLDLRRRRARWLPASLLVAIAVAGCGAGGLTPSSLGSTGASSPGAGSPPATATPSPTDSPSPTPFDPQPWLAWRPTGLGKVSYASLPGPWKGGSATASIAVYTPPGYSAGSGRRYPVLYEAPYPWSHWTGVGRAYALLNALIDSGSIPPVIAVAMSSAGGPYSDSECTNSYNGREWFDTYVAQTVVPWVDAHYDTIAGLAARAVFGASQGGYCAAALAVRHPDVFGTSLVFSGYFHAGRVGPPSTYPFGGNKAFIDAASPDVLIFDLTAAQKASLYYILVAELSQPLYGAQAGYFDGLLTQAGMAHQVINSPVPHGWPQVRWGFGQAMEAWAARMVSTGVFD